MMSSRLVVAIDYGCTFTGVGFCETCDTSALEKIIEVIQDWLSCHSKVGTRDQVPSEIAYTPDGILYGSLIPANIQRHIWTKLELDAPQPEGPNKSLRKSQFGGSAQKKAVQVVADFLAEVKVHLIKNLDRRYGTELWRTLPITLVVTVPAVWSDAAKDRTLEAVRQAGFNNSEFPQLKRVVTITEPEAAAIYTIQSLRGGIQDKQFAINDGFIVCDMGGGTVDLISYRVAELEPTVLEEATVGGGDKCGGTLVDRAFVRWLERRLGTVDFVKIAGNRSEEFPRTSMSVKLGRMLQDFVLEAKGGFSGNQKSFMRLPPPLSAIEEDEARGIIDGEIMITPDDMQEMFGFSLCRTYELLLEQMKQARLNKKVQINYIVLVGGLAESPYMFDKIQAWGEGHDLKVIRPPNAWSSIVRGAVVKGLEGDGRGQIKNRKCRRHYGTVYSGLFIPGKHRETDAYICPFSGKKRARSQVDWTVKKGQNLSTKPDAHATMVMHHKSWSHDRVSTSIDLIASDADKSPQRSKDHGVYTVATLNVDLSSVPNYLFTQCYNPTGDMYHELIFDVEISIQSSLEYSILVDGVRYGTVTAKYT